MADRGLPFWDEPGDRSWDNVILGNATFPGVVAIEGGVKRSVDVKKAKGNDQATLKDNGYQPSKLTITLTIHTEAQWSDLQRLIPTIHPKRKGGPRDPVEIVHPAPNLLGITTIYVDEIQFPKLDKKTLIVTQVLKAIEYVRKPKPLGKKGAGSGEEEIRSIGRSEFELNQAATAEDPAGVDNVVGNAVSDTFV